MVDRLTRIASLASMLSACAGPSAGGGQTPPRADDSLGRMHVYEVPNSASSPTGDQEAEAGGWIQVSGTGSVDVRPDRAAVSFAVETRQETAGGAAAGNADRMAAVLGALRAADLTGLRLETYGYALQPDYQTTSNQRSREIVAYVALNNVRAETDDVDAVGRIIDIAIDAGANRVAGISFFASDTEAARAEALAEAVRNATAEARTIARSLGYRLGPPLEINGGAQRPVPRAMEMAAMQARAPTPIEAGDQTVSASVSIRFALGPESGG